jgi:subtilase-type serine protease
MVNDRSNGIGSGSCGLASATGGWCFNKFAKNDTPGASQVMTDAPDDPFQWLRTGERNTGETAIWGRAIGMWGSTDGDAKNRGSEFDTKGAIAGIDHVFSPVFMAGAAAQYTTTDVSYKGAANKADIGSFEVGGYMAWGDARLYLNANASVIFHDIEVKRFSAGGAAHGNYDGLTLSAYAEGGKIFETEDGMRIQPLVALSFAHLDTDPYSERGQANIKLDVNGSTFDSLKGMLGVRVGFPIPLESGRKIVPEARLVLAHEFMDDQSSFTASIQNQPPVLKLIQGERFSRDTVIAGAGISVPLSEDTTLFVDYDASLNPDITTHTVSVGLRARW